MAPGIQVTPEDLEAFARKIEARIAPHLDKAQRLWHETRGLEQALYTSVTWLFATAYVAAAEFTGEDIKSKHDDLGMIMSTLDDTAKRWTAAEDKNTVKGS
jgi:hypothetical protein